MPSATAPCKQWLASVKRRCFIYVLDGDGDLDSIGESVIGQRYYGSGNRLSVAVTYHKESFQIQKQDWSAVFTIN